MGNETPAEEPTGEKVFSAFELAAANGHIVHHEAAGAARRHHGAHAIAASLNHVATGFITAHAGDADAILSHFTFAHPHREIATTDHRAVHHAAAAKLGAGHHRAEILQHAAGHLIVA